jgi:hypothetical protein
MNHQVPGQPELVFDVPTLTDDQRAELTAHVLDGWQGMGACRSTGDDTWFPEPGHATVTALDVCGFCPVRRSCLAYALADDEDYGVWGGTTEVQRDVLRQTLADDMSVPDVLDQATLLPAYIWRAA